MGTGIVLAGQAVPLAGLDISNFLDDPKLRLSSKDLRPRNPHERAFVHLVVMHSTLGIPGGTDLRRQTILPGFGPPTNAGERTVAMWASDPSRPAGAHLIVDFDGKIYCCADLVTEATYHAQLANGCSIGIEIVQGLKSAEMYTEQLAVATDLDLNTTVIDEVVTLWQATRDSVRDLAGAVQRHTEEGWSLLKTVLVVAAGAAGVYAVASAPWKRR